MHGFQGIRLCCSPVYPHAQWSIPMHTDGDSLHCCHCCHVWFSKGKFHGSRWQPVCSQRRGNHRGTEDHIWQLESCYSGTTIYKSMYNFSLQLEEVVFLIKINVLFTGVLPFNDAITDYDSSDQPEFVGNKKSSHISPSSSDMMASF